MPSDAAVILANCAAFDQRTIGRGDAAAWAEVLTAENIEPAEATAAVFAYYRAESAPIKVAELIAAVKTARRGTPEQRARLRDAGVPPIPGGLRLAEERAWRTAWCAAVKAGDLYPVTAANRAVGIRDGEVLLPMPAPIRAQIESFAAARSVPSR